MDQIKPVFQGEVQLASWSVSHNAGAKVSFWLADEDEIEPFKRLTARKGRMAGQRMMAVFVLIGDDERPASPDDAPPTSRALALSAVQLCRNPDFQEFVGEALKWHPSDAAAREEQAADFVRERCRVESRSDLDRSPTAAQLFARLMGEYRDWRKATGASA